MNNEPHWLSWAKELQFIAQSALTYCKDQFDRERFERVRDISAEIMSVQSNTPFEKVKELFCNENGFQTPKMDSRGVIIENGKFLLVQEKNGLWSLPGGWVDANQTVATNVVKEVHEEAGLVVEPVRVLAILERNRHHKPLYPYNVCKVFFLCNVISGAFEPNLETISSEYFSIDELPPLAEEKCTREELDICLNVYNNPLSGPVFE